MRSNVDFTYDLLAFLFFFLTGSVAQTAQHSGGSNKKVNFLVFLVH